MKHAILIASSLALLSLVPAVAADISILGGTAVIHTDGDPGVSVLGSPLARVFLGPCAPGCTLLAVYGSPGGVADYEVWALVCDQSPCNCAAVGAELVADVSPVGACFETDPLQATVCATFAVCLVVLTDPICVTSTLGEIVCET